MWIQNLWWTTLLQKKLNVLFSTKNPFAIKIIDFYSCLLTFLYSFEFPKLTSLNYETVANKTPNLYKLCKNLYGVYTSNRHLILYSIRIYLYTAFLLHIFTFIFLSSILYFELSNLIFWGEVVLWVYKIWGWPIRIFFWGVKHFLFLLIRVLKILIDPLKCRSSSVAETESKWPFNSNADSNFGKSPEAGGTTFMDPTEYELNCIKNKAQSAFNLYSFYNQLKGVGTHTSFAMSFDLEKGKSFKDAYTDYSKNFEQIHNHSWCPNIHKLNTWNSQFR